MSLKEELSGITGKKRRFLLFRIADVEVEAARQLCNVSKATYNLWVKRADTPFVRLYRRRDELSNEYKHEAIQMLRRDNQLAAVMLEEKIINKMKEEIDTGDYNLLRTNIARDVYNKLITDLDYTPKIQALSWTERIQNLFVEQPQREMIDGTVIEAESSVIEQHTQSNLITQSEQVTEQNEEETEEAGV